MTGATQTPNYDALNRAQQMAVRHAVLQDANMKELGSQPGALARMLEEIAGDPTRLGDAANAYRYHIDRAAQKIACRR